MSGPSALSRRKQLTIAVGTLIGMRKWLGDQFPRQAPARGQILAQMDELIDTITNYLKEAA